MPSSAREEAERLVAAVLAVADTAGPGGIADSLRDAVGDAVGRVAGTEHKPPADEHKLPADEHKPPADEHKPPAVEYKLPAVEHKPAAGWATGSAECCVCPVCRAIAAVRSP